MRIGVFCSGGDAPGMNACVRAAVRRAVSEGHDVVGINRGYQGLLDEDLGTDFTIGSSTAVQTAVEAVDKIRDTAESHERMFLIEVMGRHSGFIAVERLAQ